MHLFSTSTRKAKREKKAEEQKSQATINQINHSVGRSSENFSWARAAEKQSSQTRADIAQISTATQAETAKVLKENELNIKQSISNSLGDMKAFIQATIQQEVKLVIESIRNEIKTEIEKAFAGFGSMISHDLQESLDDTIYGMTKTLKLNTQPVSLDGARRASLGSDPQQSLSTRNVRSSTGSDKAKHSMPPQTGSKPSANPAATAKQKKAKGAKITQTTLPVSTIQ